MMETHHHPVNPYELSKGDLIGAEVVERFTGVKRSDHEKYRLAQLKTREVIIRLLDNIGKPWVIVSSGVDLQILTDEEAAKHTDKRGKSHLRKFARMVSLQASIDTNLLDETTRRDHYDALAVNGAILQGIRSARSKAYKALACKRNVPGLPQNTKESS